MRDQNSPPSTRSTEDLGKILDYLRRRSIRRLGRALLEAPEGLARIRSTCLADLLLELSHRAQTAIHSIRVANSLDSLDEDLLNTTLKLQPVWILIDMLGHAVRHERNNNVAAIRPVTQAASHFYRSHVEGQATKSGPAGLSVHELEVISDLRHQGAHYGGAPGAKMSSTTTLAGLFVLHRKTDSSAPFRFRRCGDCLGRWWLVRELLDAAEVRIAALKSDLQVLARVFDECAWPRFAPLWIRVREFEPLLADHPTIFQLNEILAHAKDPWWSTAAADVSALSMAAQRD
jgi:hypothetical protein